LKNQWFLKLFLARNTPEQSSEEYFDLIIMTITGPVPKILFNILMYFFY